MSRGYLYDPNPPLDEYDADGDNSWEQMSFAFSWNGEDRPIINGYALPPWHYQVFLAWRYNACHRPSVIVGPVLDDIVGATGIHIIGVIEDPCEADEELLTGALAGIAAVLPMVAVEAARLSTASLAIPATFITSAIAFSLSSLVTVPRRWPRLSPTGSSMPSVGD